MFTLRVCRQARSRSGPDGPHASGSYGRLLALKSTKLMLIYDQFSSLSLCISFLNSVHRVTRTSPRREGPCWMAQTLRDTYLVR